MKLISKFKKPSPNDATQKKHQMFVHVLRGMKADIQTDGIDTPEDYTRVWTEQIDRGGLYKIRPEVCGISCILDVIYLCE